MLSELPGRLISAEATVSQATPPTGTSLKSTRNSAAPFEAIETGAGARLLWVTVTLRR